MRHAIPIAVAALVLGLGTVASPPTVEAEEEAAPAPILLRLDAQGTAKATWTDERSTVQTLAAVELGTDKPKLLHRALKRLLDGFAIPMKGDRNRAEDGSSRLRLVIEAEGEAKWKWVQWIMQVAASPDVKIWQLELRRDRATEGERIELPRDRGLIPGHVVEFAKVKLTLFRKNAAVPSEAFTRIRVDRDKKATVDLPTQHDTEYASSYEEAVASIRAHVEKRLATHGKRAKVRAELVAPPPTGGDVPYQDAIRMVELFRALKLQDIVFQGAPAPLPHPAPR